MIFKDCVSQGVTVCTIVCILISSWMILECVVVCICVETLGHKSFVFLRDYSFRELSRISNISFKKVTFENDECSTTHISLSINDEFW